MPVGQPPSAKVKAGIASPDSTNALTLHFIAASKRGHLIASES